MKALHVKRTRGFVHIGVLFHLHTLFLHLPTFNLLSLHRSVCTCSALTPYTSASPTSPSSIFTMATHWIFSDTFSPPLTPEEDKLFWYGARMQTVLLRVPPVSNKQKMERFEKLMFEEVVSNSVFTCALILIQSI